MDTINSTFDIIIPVIYRDFSFLKKTISYIEKYLNYGKIFIITDIRFKRFLPKVILENEQYSVIDENNLLDGLDYFSFRKKFKALGRNEMKAGWYYQQLLKMAFALSDYCNTDYYLSWDSDTVPLRKIPFFDGSGKPYFTMKTEHHDPYFVSIGRLFGITNFNSASYIAENMMFNKIIMVELVNNIQHNVQLQGKTWFEKIMYSLEPETVSPLGFSEFETYGNYCYNYHPDFYVERTLPSFRSGGLIQGRLVSDKILNQLSFDQATASFEIYDRPPFPWGKISYWYARWQQKKELFIRRWLL